MKNYYLDVCPENRTVENYSENKGCPTCFLIMFPYRRDGMPQEQDQRRFRNAVRRKPPGTLFVYVTAVAEDQKFGTSSHRQRVVAGPYG